MESDWFIFADAGVCWPKNFLLEIIPYFRVRSVMAVAPTYYNPNGSALEKCVWWFECHLKEWENTSGGPISVHGATICYRREELLATLSALNNHEWLNDDVVLPLKMRDLFSDRKICYLPNLAVYELPRIVRQAEFGRRRRMVFGNIEWIKKLWIPICRTNPAIALLAMRRIFRLFWAYWVLLSVAAVFLFIRFDMTWTKEIPDSLALLSFIIFPFIIFLISVYVYRRSLTRLSESLCASLLAPYYFMAQILQFSSFNKRLEWQ